MQQIIRATGQLGPVLRQLRLSKDWTQSELGRRVGLSQERISAIEKHPESVTLDRLLTIMATLGADLVVHADVRGQDALADSHKSGKETW
jgi:HTH-type transcriptional regulator/antitoxin HipB